MAGVVDGLPHLLLVSFKTLNVFSFLSYVSQYIYRVDEYGEGPVMVASGHRRRPSTLDLAGDE